MTNAQLASAHEDRRRADARGKLVAIRDLATKHVRPTPQQLEGYRDRLYQVVRATGYDSDVFRFALDIEDEIRRRHNWMT